MSTLIAGILLASGAVAFVLIPVLLGKEAPLEREDAELTDAQHRKRVALLALRDIEYDYHAGKLDTEDYRSLKQKLSTEALEAIDAEEAEWIAREAGREDGVQLPVGKRAEPHLPPELEAEIAALRVSIREGIVCPQCGHPNPRGSRFCGDCGSGLPASESPSGRPQGQGAS